MIVTEGWSSSETLDAGDKRATALKDRLGWLQEWESAQRQQRQQVGGRPTANEEFQGGSRAGNAACQTMGRTQPGSPMLAADRQPVAIASEKGVSSTTSFDRATITANRPDAVEGRPPGAAGTFSHVPRLGGPWTPSTAHHVTWFPRTPGTWQPYVYQVVRSGIGVRVWIRDARIDANSGSGILNALRSQFASVGVALVGVTINGKTMWEAPADGQRPEMSGGDADNALLVNQLY